ncbi:flagellar brake protein [Vibrio tapetis]|uniref:Flagellar brake protein n=1 Tax=Vibrio tapetis subsp. tapetis TaxID=1671868 RepID=A0A2N8ZKU3_9VIBR|nr:conserved protein of unknown function [Vibrio tapetis subsp. tapetis]
MAKSSAADALKDKIDNSDLKGTETIMKSSEALAMVSHSSDLTINITTPVGIKYQGTTSFIGTHGSDYILLEMPEMSDEDHEYFLQEGFWMNIRAISPRGEGALLYFRSQILHIIETPVQMMLISIPSTIKVLQLRKEPRYDVALSAVIYCNEHKVEAEVRDLSKGGCRVETSPLVRTFQVNDTIRVELVVRTKTNVSLPVLTGKICNLQRSKHNAKYGLVFDDPGKEGVKKLLACLKFDGSKLALKA